MGLVALRFIFQAITILAILRVSEAVFGKAAWFDPSVGLTACGTNASEFASVAAVGFSHWTTPNSNDDPMCESIVKVTDPMSEKSVIVAVVDKCRGCKEEDINLSKEMFKQFRPLEEGSFVVNWEFLK